MAVEPQSIYFAWVLRLGIITAHNLPVELKPVVFEALNPNILFEALNPEIGCYDDMLKHQLAVSSMAFAAGFGISFRPYFPLLSPLSHCIRKVRLGSVAAVVDEPDNFFKGYNSSSQESATSSIEGVVDGGAKTPAWKRFGSKELGITNALIPRPTRVVLSGLKRKGFKVYLIGGCVWDLILKRKPKDFDILTSAELREIIGKRFPICHVHVDGTIVELSSTSVTRSQMDFMFDMERPVGCEKKDYTRWRNCLQRDFTINGLMLDPYAELVYDHMGGVEDIRKAKVQTVKPSRISFWEDCARILRGIRIAAHLGFVFTRETAHNVKNLASLVLILDKGRLLMEMNYVLAYGSAESSLRLSWKVGLLDILLPIQAAYFVRRGFRRRQEKCLFSNLDKFLVPDKVLSQ